jgi:tRNA_anti-like
MKPCPFFSTVAALTLALSASLPAQNVNLGESEALKCEEKIASVRRDVLGKYEDSLGELQATLQKAADLEGSLAVRAERQRVAKDRALFERDFVAEPKSLRALQVQHVTKMQELVGQVVAEALPKLIELKKSMTVAGKLDDAVAVRTAIGKLQNSHVPVARPEAGAVVPAETLLVAYSGDRARADKTYKGQKIVVRGAISGFRVDPADARSYQIYLAGGSGGGFVQCAFSMNTFRFREEKNAFGAVTLVISAADGDGPTMRVQKGQPLDIRGTCEGLDEVVRLGRCEVLR